MMDGKVCQLEEGRRKKNMLDLVWNEGELRNTSIVLENC